MIYRLVALAAASLFACAAPSQTTQTASGDFPTKVVLASQVEWSALNPARGNKGPKAATLWGDRTAPGPSGFLVEFLEGFSSPPHIHNVSYRGMVIHGLVHNDDPNADKMWMPKGSFWTQPKGGVHITAANAKRNLAYIEIEDGPYLVQPLEQAFQGTEVPINVDASNIVWLDKTVQDNRSAGPKVAHLFGNPNDQGISGNLIKLPAQFHGSILCHGASFRAVVIQGQPSLQTTTATVAHSLEPGSYFRSNGKSTHPISNPNNGECILYVRAEGQFEVAPTPK